MRKKELHQTFLARRKDMSSSEAKRLSMVIQGRLVVYKAYKQAKKILFYSAIDNEPDLTNLIRRALVEGKQVYLPKVKGTDLLVAQIKSLSELKTGAFGVLEPITQVYLDPVQLDLVLVPGIVFDQSGYRIGYGKGFYDRLLRKTTCLKLGVAYAWQIVEKIPHAEHDVALDDLIS